MTNKVIIYTHTDGNVRVFHPAPEMFDPNSKTRALLPHLDGKSAEEIWNWIYQKSIPADAITPTMIDKSSLPSREFRNAWDQKGSTVTHDMDKARNIWKDKMRAARKPLLESLDIQYQQADEADDKQKKKQIADKKQELRDVTDLPALSAAQTIEAIKAVWPDCLGARA